MSLIVIAVLIWMLKQEGIESPVGKQCDLAQLVDQGFETPKMFVKRPSKATLVQKQRNAVEVVQVAARQQIKVQ